MRIIPWLVGLLAIACDTQRPEEPSRGGGEANPSAAPEVWVEAGQGLPAGESSADSVEATVSGNDTATAYQFALLRDADAACDTANYGEFLPLDTKLAVPEIGGNGEKTLCLRGKNEHGEVQDDPKRYSWTKVDGAATDDKLPNAYLETQPIDTAAKLVNEIVGNDITTHYQYVLIQEKEYDCADIATDSDVSYRAAQPINKILELTVGANGPKTLCLRGLGDNSERQLVATRYTWEKQQPTPSPDDEQPATQAKAVGALKVLNKNLTIISGSVIAYPVTVSNIGQGTLRWKVKSEQAAAWLQFRSGLTGTYQPVSAAESLASGTLAAGKSTAVYFKLSKGSGTDYGRPYRRERLFTFSNTDSGFRIKTTIALEIPLLDTSTWEVELTHKDQSVSTSVQNLNKASNVRFGNLALQIEAVPAFDSTLTKQEKVEKYEKFSSLVTIETGIMTTRTSTGEKYVKFTPNPNAATDCEVHRQEFLVYSNGDSKGASDCNIEAGIRYIGGDANASWTTRRCKRIEVTFNGYKHTDVTNDGVVNIFDLTKAASSLGARPTQTYDPAHRADVNGDGTVDQADLDEIRKCFNSGG